MFRTWFRIHTIRVYCSFDEKRAIKARAKRLGMRTAGAYLRYLFKVDEVAQSKQTAGRTHLPQDDLSCPTRMIAGPYCKFCDRRCFFAGREDVNPQGDCLGTGQLSSRDDIPRRNATTAFPTPPSAC
jgi:hypothetical protein